MKSDIINFAESIGINRLSFLQARPFFRDKTRLHYAEEKGYLSSFLKKEENKDMNKEYQTIICALVSYPNPKFFTSGLSFEKENNLKPYGKISSSSWGQDYHKTLFHLLTKLAVFIKGKSDLNNYEILVDNTSCSEREIAVKSGLGWIGKNSNLINKDLGSFVFIGELYLDINIDSNDESKEVKDFCGDCMICYHSCPVKAIDPINRVVNTKLCLSQQTQEKEIDNLFIREKIKETKYIYGCDICQIVCPYNQKEREYHPLFAPKINEVYPDLNLLLNESNRSFKEKYGHLSASWRGKKTIQKNIDIILSDFDI